jgi:hypothetical protein
MTVLQDGRCQIWNEVELVKVVEEQNRKAGSVRHVANPIFNFFFFLT